MTCDCLQFRQQGVCEHTDPVRFHGYHVTVNRLCYDENTLLVIYREAFVSGGVVVRYRSPSEWCWCFDFADHVAGEAFYKWLGTLQSL